MTSPIQSIFILAGGQKQLFGHISRMNQNLAMAMTVEVAELLEHFQWLTEEQSNNLSPEKKALVANEIAAIQIYLIRMADKLGIDIHE